MVERFSAGWLDDPGLQKVFAAIARDGDTARVVGGAIRNTLLGVPVSDIDIATTAVPDTVLERARDAGLKAVPTGIDHGTVTIIVDHHPFEITTLREDIETFGRKAKVRFGRDWSADAHRRDFTMNALYVSADGALYDDVGGYADCLARRVRFIGDADERLREDYLRILRFFRFHASYGDGRIDQDGLAATIRARDGLRKLSAERIGQEMCRLVEAPGAAATTRIMANSGILQIVLGGVGFPESLGRLTALAAAMALPVDDALSHAALGGKTRDDALRVTERLRLSNGMRKRMIKVLDLAVKMRRPIADRTARYLLYRSDAETFRGAALLTWAWSGDPDDTAYWRQLVGLPGRWSPPAFPVAGRDVMALGLPSGPSIGEVLESAEAWWIDKDFRPGRDDILDHVKTLCVRVK